MGFIIKISCTDTVCFDYIPFNYPLLTLLSFTHIFTCISNLSYQCVILVLMSIFFLMMIIIASSYIHFLERNIILFLFMSEWCSVLVCVCDFLYLLFCWNLLSWFYNLIFVNYTVFSMNMQVFILDANTDSFSYIHRSSRVELYFRFQGISKLISIVDELIYILPSNIWGFLVSYILTNTGCFVFPW